MLIKSFEGFRPRAVRNEAGAWVIGYGHTASAREGATIGEPDAELLLQYDLMPVVRALNDGVTTPLNQHQFDALASFAISVGVEAFLQSDVLGRLNSGHPGEAADALIDWPEQLDEGDRLRRRAAERALFVADPAGPVALADLLAAPLPPPRPVAAPDPEPVVVRPDFSGFGSSPVDVVGPSAMVEVEPEAVEAPIPVAVPEPVTATAQHQNLRYSAYAAPVVGALPGFPIMPAPAVEPEVQPAPPEAEAPIAPAAEAPLEEVSFGNPPAPAVPTDAAFPEPAPSAFPPLDALVLTPAVETDFLDNHRPVWSPEQRQGEAPAEPLFDDEPTLSVLRHEAEPDRPRRFDWSETGAFLIMGGVGLAACAASAAAFRLSVTEPSDMGETTVIAWALALIGAICVGVSSWNLYVRWGKQD
ncbi:MAG: glycoside hydrolase family protein [Brevundimonas sp.]|nr:glycoside hydrolase family protein [Brevundimonas sp.]